ncbi:polysaccharide lyase 6 family protein [Neptunicella marina]|uniref:Alginate lyase n=1 Tax=Neptunicella marina TaxID=2125989 RepID=A0A8J6ITZ7_9ALTE|nr:polysaccharide lyase 6 family protein [Neptunicella marina]MBC3765810.1 alginate lyase [Neptunicella marina]
MRFLSFSSFKAVVLFSFFIAPSISAKQYFIENKQAYQDIASHLVAGDSVTLKNGVWTDFEILLKGKGTKQSPISLTAETKGKVILSGQSNLRLAGEYLQASGLVFKNGYTPTSAVIEFRQNKENLAYHSRVTEMVIDNFNNPDKEESDYWIALYGQHNRFDHNHIVGKRNKGVTLAVRLDSENSQQNYHQIDHNYFGYRPVFGSNGGETIRIGTSHYSLTNSNTRVENNYFEHTNGEVEIISVKSGKNIIRGNVFFEARGTLTLRHGRGNLIENNIFIGNGKDHTGGIRVINEDQIIRNNYLEGLTGYRFGSGFTVMNGVPNSPINRYNQVDNATIENNTFINVRHIQLAAGSDRERSATPINSRFRKNLVFNVNAQQPFTVFDDVSGILFADNIANSKVLPELAAGFKQQQIELKLAPNGLLYPDSSINAGASRDLTTLSRNDTGVSWYAKVPAVVAFDSGKTHTVNAEPAALLTAIQNAESGDVLEIKAGAFTVPKLIDIDKTLTIRAQKAGSVTLSYERSTLFEIKNGGSLKLDGLIISGERCPDAAGNSVVRTQKWGMIENYRLEVLNAKLVDLDINHSFSFFVTGKGALADNILLENNQFSKVTGDILRLNTEIENLGVYNAEYVTLQHNVFNDIKGAVTKLYRGGTDESTFGPHFVMTDNQLTHVGFGKRNKRNASVYLQGVQVTNISNNQFKNSAPVRIDHTVGEPKTLIARNTFDGTSAPVVQEIHFGGPSTAIVKNNTLINQTQD